MADLPISLLRLLADGASHSGAELGRALDISRAAVWKQVQRLQALGLSVEAVRGQGYRLSQPLDLLERDTILAQLDAPAKARLAHLELLWEIDSTNSYLARLPGASTATGQACTAERQLSGRGRRRRPWLSPFARHVYLSLCWDFQVGPAELGALSLAAGVAVYRALTGLGVRGVGLKWPNDVLVSDAKLAGVLVELSGESDGPTRAIIGTGLNVDMPPEEGASLNQPWTDLRHLAPEVSRSVAAGSLLRELLTACASFAERGFEPLRSTFEAADVLAGREVEVQRKRHPVVGRVEGIDDDGSLLLRTGETIERLHAGEVTLRSRPR